MGATEGVGIVLIINAFLGKAKVSQLDMSFLIQDHIIRFHISIDYSFSVEVFNGEEDLSDVDFGNFFREPPFLLEDGSDVPTGAVLQDEEQLCGILEGILQLYYEGVADLAQDVSLSLSVLHDIVLHYLLFVKHLHGILHLRMLLRFY